MADSLEAALQKAAPRVLVVDDDENLLANLGAFLESQGYRVHCSSDPMDAIKAWDVEPFDGVVTDYRLGTQSGLNLIQDIRTRDPECPIILMSAYMDDWVEALANSIGPIECLKKPFAGQDLVDTLKQAMVRADAVRD